VGPSYTERALYRAALVLNNETITPTVINVEPNALGWYLGGGYRAYSTRTKYRKCRATRSTRILWPVENSRPPAFRKV